MTVDTSNLLRKCPVWAQEATPAAAAIISAVTITKILETSIRKPRPARNRSFSQKVKAVLSKYKTPVQAVSAVAIGGSVYTCLKIAMSSLKSNHS